MSDADARQALRVDEISHTYVDETVLNDISLTVRDGEFLTLLGPSGCGKTTLLRIIAGLIRPSAGKVFVHGDDVTRLPAHRRPLNMVFQRGALFPHLDVFDNVAFGLRLAKVGRDEINERVAAALRLVRLDDLAHRRSHEISGGQAQRVALARALVNRPRVLLMDEPLSALDLRIRLQMEIELRRLHRETGATFIYVTHDQREALALSDRIAVFERGRIEQVGSPEDVYRRPASAFTARFVGDANVLATEVTVDSGGEARASVAGVDIPLLGEHPARSAWLVLRQEDLVVRRSDDGAVPAAVNGMVRDTGFRGTGFAYRIEVPGMPELLKAETSSTVDPIAVGSRVSVSWERHAALVLPRNP